MAETQIPAELEKQLMRIGLTNYQARVYRAVFILNECSISQIANYSKVPTAKIYTTIRELKEMGLIAEILKTRPAMFKAFPPDQYIEQEKDKIIEIGKHIKRYLEDLEHFRKSQVLTEEFETTSIGNELLVKNLILASLTPTPKDVILVILEDFDFYEAFLSRLERAAKSSGKSQISVTLIDPYERELDNFSKYATLNIQIIIHQNLTSSLIESLKNLHLLCVMDENCFINVIKTEQNVEYLHIKSNNCADFLRSLLKSLNPTKEELANGE